jgi:zinc protease
MWTATLANGVRVIGSRFERVPMTRLALALPAGRSFEPPEQSGLARLTAEMLEEGTRSLSGNEFLDELDGLGAQLSTQVGDESLVLRLSVLDEHLARALELLVDLVLEPRFAERDFARVQRTRLVEIDTRADRSAELAEDGFARFLFGAEDPRGRPGLGRRETVAALGVEDVRAFWRARARPGDARLALVGAHGHEARGALFGTLERRWPAGDAPAPRPAPCALPPRGPLRLALIDKPGAAQSELRVGHLGVASTDPDFHPLQALNHVLGGAFSSRLNLNLREDKGYTYGVHSAFTGGLQPGAFRVDCAVASAVTAPALAEILSELRALRAGLRREELEFTRRSLSRALARSLESSQARLGLLEAIGLYGYPLDVLERRLAWLQGMGLEDLDRLARRHVRPDELWALVVGDRARVLSSLQDLGWGEVAELDPEGRPLVPAAR